METTYQKPQVDFLESETIVKRDENFICNFKITKPVMLTDIEQQYEMQNEIIDNMNLFTSEINLTNWIEIHSFQNTESEDNNKFIKVTGLQKVLYNYEVYFNNKLIKPKIQKGYYEDINNNIIIQSSMFNNNVDGIVKIIVYYTDQAIEFTKNFTLINTKPYTLIQDIINNKINIQINDDENDTVQFKILLNGKPLYPIIGDFSEEVNVPYFYSKTLNSDEVIINSEDFINPNNTLTIITKDKYGAESEPLIKYFVGQYVGIMFVDENDKYYSNDLGTILLRELYMGKIQAGHKSVKKVVYLKNNTQYNLSNIQVHLDDTNIPEKTFIRISKNLEEDFQNMTKDIDFKDEILHMNNKIPFYVQANTDFLTQGGGEFYFDVVADAIET